MIIRFKDYRSLATYGKEIYTTNDFEDARRYMRENKEEMRFQYGGGKTENGIETEIYWDVCER